MTDPPPCAARAIDRTDGTGPWLAAVTREAELVGERGGDDAGDELGPEPGSHEHRVVAARDPDERCVTPLRLQLLDESP